MTMKMTKQELEKDLKLAKKVIIVAEACLDVFNEKELQSLHKLLQDTLERLGEENDKD